MDREALRRRTWRLTRRRRLIQAREYAARIRLATTDEDRWHYATLLVDYRRLAHALAEELAS